MTAVGLDPVGPDQLGPHIGRVEDVFGDDTHVVPGDAAADGDAVVQPLELSDLLFGDAGAGIQMEPSGTLVDHEVEERLAVQVLHDVPAKLVDQFLGVVG